MERLMLKMNVECFIYMFYFSTFCFVLYDDVANEVTIVFIHCILKCFFPFIIFYCAFTYVVFFYNFCQLFCLFFDLHCCMCIHLLYFVFLNFYWYTRKPTKNKAHCQRANEFSLKLNCFGRPYNLHVTI